MVLPTLFPETKLEQNDLLVPCKLRKLQPANLAKF